MQLTPGDHRWSKTSLSATASALAPSGTARIGLVCEPSLA